MLLRPNFGGSLCCITHQPCDLVTVSYLVLALSFPTNLSTDIQFKKLSVSVDVAEKVIFWFAESFFCSNGKQDDGLHPSKIQLSFLHPFILAQVLLLLLSCCINPHYL